MLSHTATQAARKEEARMEVERRDRRSRDLLDAAKQNINSNRRIAKLIAQGADPNTRDGHHSSALHMAAKNPTITNELILQGADVNCKDKDGRTPLSCAAEVDSASSVQLLLDKGADVNSQDRQGQTPLIWAVQEGSVKAVRMLLANGADKTIRDIDSSTPYNHACMSVEANKDTFGRDKSIKIKNMFATIPNGSIVNYPMEGLTNPLVAEMRAFQIHEPTHLWREINVEKYLKVGDVDVNGEDEYHRSPLSYATEYNQPGVARILLEHGADVRSKDVNGRTPLSWAASSFAPFLVELLIRNKADIDSQDFKGQTPLSWAAQSGDQEAARILTANDADRTVKDAKNASPFDYARMNAEIVQEPRQKEAFMRIMRLLDPSPKPRQDDIGNSFGEKYPDKFDEMKMISAKSRGERLCSLASHWRYRNRDTPVEDLEEMTALLRAGADVNFRHDAVIGGIKNCGSSPLHFAARYDRCDIIQLLLNWYAEVDSKDDFGSTPLTVAAGQDSVDAAELLIQAGADINCQTKYKRTPLLNAVEALALEMVEKLLANDADTAIRDNMGYSAYDSACRIATAKITEFRDIGIKMKDLLDPSQKVA